MPDSTKRARKPTETVTDAASWFTLGFSAWPWHPIVAPLPVAAVYTGAAVAVLAAAWAAFMWRRAEKRILSQAQAFAQAQATRDAETAERFKEFLVTVNYEFRTPIDAMNKAIATLRAARLDSRVMASAETLHCGGLVLGAIATRVFEVAGLEQKDLPMDYLPFAPRTMLSSVAGMLAVISGRDDGLIGCEVDVDVPEEMIGDERRIEQVLVNYGINALKYGEGRISLSALVDEGSVLFEVRDRGPGITDEEQALLFEPYTRLRGAKRLLGSGVGLAVCKRLALRMGGAVGVASEGGAGACFWLRLPIRVPQKDAPIQTEIGFIPNGIHALVVEDTAYNAEAIVYMLREQNVVADAVASAEEALERIEEKAYRLFVVDRMLNGMGGIEFTRIIRSKSGDVRNAHVIGMSGGSTEDDRRLWRSVGVNIFLPKPITPDKLRSALARLAYMRLQNGAQKPEEVEQKIDLKILRLIAKGDSKALVEEGGKFIAELSGCFAALEASMQAQDVNALRKNVHKLGSLALTISGELVVVPARKLEREAFIYSQSDLASAVEKIGRAVRKLVEQLRAEIKPPSDLA
jgi:signal transduction histidine kinase/CheY-like chemotaxis protein/HPt (histidine-containing phosphotransfer) domain-containing protein